MPRLSYKKGPPAVTEAGLSVGGTSGLGMWEISGLAQARFPGRRREVQGAGANGSDQSPGRIHGRPTSRRPLQRPP
jgi:hypothetical protein